MSGEFPSAAKIVSPAKCNEKPWDLWVSEIGHQSPLRDEARDGAAEGKSAAGKAAERGPRYRRSGLNRLKYETMSLHGLLPQMDNLNAAVCHMCGVVVKCSAAYRHLLESHTETEPILPPPAAPTVKIKGVSRSRHKKELPPPPIPVEALSVKMDMSPVHSAALPLSRVVLPQSDLFLDEASTSAVSGDVQVSIESGELPVVSIQDPEDLPLVAEDIFEIMNSEGIQSADNITNAADWNNIIRDIGNMQEINFPQTTDSQSQDLYAPVDTSSLYTIPDTDLSSLQFAPNTSPMLSSVIDSNIMNVNTQQALKPQAATAPSTPSTKSQSRTKASKKFNLREYDPNKHCGVVTIENPKPCTRSLTCKAHALSLRRMVEGRSKTFDTLLAEHRASREASAAAAAAPAPAPPPLVNNTIDLGAFNNLTPEQQVNNIYASLLEDPNSVLPDTSSITELLNQTLPVDLILPDEAELPPDVPLLSIASPVEAPPPERPEAGPPPLVPADVCWYASCPRPLALCTFNASHAGGAITLGKKFATVRSNIKSSLSRSQKSTVGSNNYYYNQNCLSLSKSVHMNASKGTHKPEVRRLVAGGGPLNGHTLSGHSAHSGLAARPLRPALKKPAQGMLDLAFALDPLLADEKC